MYEPSERKRLLEALQSNDLASFIATFEKNNWPIVDSCWDYDLLIVAIKSNRKQFVNYLLDKGCRVYIKPDVLTPLHFAVANVGWQDVIVRLVSLKCPIDAKYIRGSGETAVHYAYYKGISGETIDLLLWLYLNNNDNGIENVMNDDGLSFLHIACSRDNVNVVERFISGNPLAVDLVEKRHYLRPLHFAVQHKKYVVANFLLQCKADIYRPNRDKSTPLHMALKLRDVDMINIILEYDGRKKNVVDKFGLSHFMAACAGGCERIVQEYLRLAELRSRVTPKEFVNAKVVNSSEFHHYTPLHFAVDFGQIRTVKCLLNHKAECCVAAAGGHTPHTLAREKGHDLIYNLLNEYCSAFKNCRDTVSNFLSFENVLDTRGLHRYATSMQPSVPPPPPPKVLGSQKLCRILPALPPPSRISQALSLVYVPINVVNGRVSTNGMATTQNRTSAKSQADPSVQKQLINALEQNNVDEFLSTLKTKGCPKSFEVTLLMSAIKFERKRMVLALLERNCRVLKSTNANSCAKTPLHLVATKVGWTDVVERLLEKGCRADDEDSKGDTSLHLAFAAGNVESTIDVLLKSHIATGYENVKKKHDGFLHIACTRPSLEVVKKLIGANYIINTPYSESKATSLHFAVLNKRHEIAEYLIKHGAVIYVQNSNGSTALHLALELKDIRMIDLLLAYDTVKKDLADRFGATHFMAACAGTNVRIVHDYLWYGETRFQMSPYSMISAQVKNYSHNQISGYTPLHFASHFGRVHTAELILNYGADCCLVAANGLNCHALAKKSGMDVYRNLKEHCDVVKRCRETRAESPDFGRWGEKYECEVLLEMTRSIKSLKKNLSHFRLMSGSYEDIDIDD